MFIYTNLCIIYICKEMERDIYIYIYIIYIYIEREREREREILVDVSPGYF